MPDVLYVGPQKDDRLWPSVWMSASMSSDHMVR
jgi:hypothetical protein